MSREQRELGILYAVAEALNSSPDVRQALERTLGLVADLLGLRTGWVWLLDQETHRFYSAVERELPPYLQERVRMAGRRNCWCIDDFRDGELTPTNIDVMECSRLQPAFRGKSESMAAGLRYHASIPLYFQDKPLGIMNVTGPEKWRKLTSEELRLLATIANQVGIAIERARLAEEATRLARAEERARIAREIHDTLAQGLTAIALNIEGAMHRMESRPEQARERLQRALDMARENLEEARRSVLDLRATMPLAGKPLGDALVSLGRTFTSETGVTVLVKADENLQLPIRMEAELFRIAQEALTNVRKHARAHQVEVTLRRHGQSVSLAIRDDGLGFAWQHRRPDAHGIIGMRERARLLDGRLRVTSRPGQGTRISATVPISGLGRAMIRLLVVDDHPIVRQGLVGVLEDEADLEVVGSFGSAREALAEVRRLQPDVVLLDLEMPDLDGVAAIPEFLATRGELAILVFTAYDTEERVLGAIRAGARGYLLKGASSEEIARAVRQVHGGGSYLEPRVAARVMAQMQKPRRSSTELSAREREVLRLVAEGLPTKQIARSLTITERTVKFHVNSIFHKLGAENRAQAVALAAQRGLL